MQTHDTTLWTEIEAQGRLITWLARTTGISKKRLYALRHRGGWWRSEEVSAISRALGKDPTLLFGPDTLILPPGRRYPSRRGAISGRPLPAHSRYHRSSPP